MSTRGKIGPAEASRLAALLLLVVAAPAVGDIGSCGEAPSDLNPIEFFQKKAATDCARCGECGFSTAACARACDPKQTQAAFPEGCYPITHDGEVCQRALEATTCETYALFIADVGATIPTECNFCPAEQAP